MRRDLISHPLRYRGHCIITIAPASELKSGFRNWRKNLNMKLIKPRFIPYEQAKKAAEILWQLLDADTEDTTETKFQFVLESKRMIHSSEEIKN